MKKITVTEHEMLEAAAAATCGDLKELVESHFSLFLFVPIIVGALWEELVKMKGEANDEGKVD